MMLMIQLQAAIGLGILLSGFAFFSIAIIFPTVWITITLRLIRKAKKNEQTLNWKTYSFSVLKGFAFGILSLLIIAVIVFLFLYFFVDLSIS